MKSQYLAAPPQLKKIVTSLKKQGSLAFQTKIKFYHWGFSILNQKLVGSVSPRCYEGRGISSRSTAVGVVLNSSPFLMSSICWTSCARRLRRTCGFLCILIWSWTTGTPSESAGKTWPCSSLWTLFGSSVASLIFEVSACCVSSDQAAGDLGPCLSHISSCGVAQACPGTRL